MSRRNLSFITLMVAGLVGATLLSMMTSGRLAAERLVVDAPGDPNIISSLSPRLQSVSSGASAEFLVTITNSGPVPFKSVAVTSASSPDCDRDDLGSLDPGNMISYYCGRGNVTQSYLNAIEVTASADSFSDVTHRADAYVEVKNNSVSIEMKPESQQVVFNGTATFTVTLKNLTSVAQLVKGVVYDPMPDCDITEEFVISANESWPLPPCVMPNVQEPVTAIATVTLGDSSNSTASTAAWVEVLKLDAVLTPSTTSLSEPGGSVTYTIDLVNSGSVRLNPTQLTTDRFGDLLDPANPLVPSATNNCLSPASLEPNGGAYRCTFIVEVVDAQPPDYTLVLTASGKATDSDLTVTTTAQSTIAITDVPASMLLSLEASPSFISPPGRQVAYTIRVKNTSLADAITITRLEDQYKGDLNGVGTCALPTEAILPGETYTCQFSDQVAGQDGDHHTREITAHALSDDNEELTVSEEVIVSITGQIERKFFFPVSINDVVEPNNHCLRAYPLALNRQYYFLPPQQYNGALPVAQRDQDYFTFVLNQAAKVDIDLTNFVPGKGQLIVRGHTPGGDPPCVPALSQHIITQANHLFHAANGQALQPGRYYIQLINDGPSNLQDYYGLQVKMIAP